MRAAHDPDSPATRLKLFRDELAIESPALFGKNAIKTKAGSKAPPRQPTFREELLKEDPTIGEPNFAELLGKPGIWKQIFFASALGICVFFYAADRANLDTRWLIAAHAAPFLASNDRLRHLRKRLLTDKLGKILKRTQDAVSFIPKIITTPFLWMFVKASNAYISSSEGTRAAYQICFINGVVWIMWQINSLKPFMKAHFTHNPLSGRYITLLTSVFSHQSFIHLLANSFALVSFGSAATSYLMAKQTQNKEGFLESTPKYQFLAAYIGDETSFFHTLAGLFSALASHVVAARIAYPRILAELRSSKAAKVALSNATTTLRNFGETAKESAAMNVPRAILPSLGASGAIYGTVLITAFAYPDAEVFLLFPPIPLPIIWGVGGMVALDIMGIIRGWRLFDHWAHLSGAAFGLWYYKYGPDYWNAARVEMAQQRGFK
ncbi:hypothetical protein EW145_g7073 [Phellinidium pouzarii]|uniref:Peptidase S54 rhomboid domain-containing protein n=1 Tax=Phellinidium pouzarii TaxID=167371 RepID=A0A4S4KQ38_9AGAM|nr:hypothetical protein EW145_g7073 [Phellinidium pouzarii]